ncbi:hypothetical protein Tco_1074992 [Tanacetum coccineum]
MSSHKFAKTHNLVAFLEKPAESEGFEQIVDFLNANPIRYALTINPTIYISCIQQFWDSAKLKTVNGDIQIQALIDGKKIIVNKESIRRDLKLDDAEGSPCLPYRTIFEELTRIRMVKNLENVNKLWMYLRFVQVFVNQQLGDMSKHKKTFVNPSLTKKLFRNVKREGTGFSGKITPLFDTMMVQASEEVGEDSDHPTNSNQIPIVDQLSTSSPPKKKQKSKRKQRKEAEIAHDKTKHEESVPTPSNDPLPSGEDSMQLNDLMILCTKLQKQVLDLEKAKSDQAIEIASLKKRVDMLEKRRKFRTTVLKRLKKVGATRRTESSNDSLGAQEDASKQGRIIKDIDADAEFLDDDDGVYGMICAPTFLQIVEEYLAQNLNEIKEPKRMAKGNCFPIIRKRMVTLSTVSMLHNPLIRQRKRYHARAERSLKIHTLCEGDRLLAERLQTREREELTDEEKGKLFMELMEKRRKYFAALREQEE